LYLPLLSLLPYLFLSVHSRKWLSVTSGRRRAAGPIEPLKARTLRYDVRESDPSLSRRAGSRPAVPPQRDRLAVCRRKSPGRDSSLRFAALQNDNMADECMDVTLSSATDPSKAKDFRPDVLESMPCAAPLV
jgi:hypothetical protein